MSGKARTWDASTVVLLLIPTLLVVAGLVGAMWSGEGRAVLARLLIAGALVIGYLQARRSRGRGPAPR